MSGCPCSSQNTSGSTLPCLGASERERIIENIKRGDAGHKASAKLLLPALELQRQQTSIREDSDPVIHQPEEIERPKSALHSGDFRQTSSTSEGTESANAGFWDSGEASNFAAWYQQQYQDSSASFSSRQNDAEWQSSPRAPSIGSWISNFAYRPPTSPLVQQSNNNDLESSNDHVYQAGTAIERSNRRRTLPPETFRSIQSSPLARQQSQSIPSSSLKREHTFPYQAHQPRRSLSSMHSFNTPSNPQTPAFLRSRRPSLSSDVSPLQHASMVGSYEESILRGRMSTTPSRPLDFVAQIGVLGRGNCQPKLQCPPHVTVPFSAVFYSYPETSGRRSISDDSPSPYVGTIDLEHYLKPAPQLRRNHKTPLPLTPDVEREGRDITAPENTSIGLDIERKKREKRARLSCSPAMPVGGCYRIPQEGQLQIVIKNQNKTAVKLFLIPYSLEGMEPGTKTFIRQRSYSHGPIVEPAIGSSPSSTSAPYNAELATDKPILRYLVHLMICCPAKGRFYLYDNIRVVFANRVPDGKESLKNEIQYPDPRYSPFKPVKESIAGSGSTKLAIEMAARRRSSGFNLPTSSYYTSAAAGYQPSTPPPLPYTISSSMQSKTSSTNLDTFPFPFNPPPFQTSAYTAANDQRSIHTQPDMSMSMSISPTATPPLRQIGFQPRLNSPSPSSSSLSSPPPNPHPHPISHPHTTDSTSTTESLRYIRTNTPEPGYRNGNESSLLARKLKGLDMLHGLEPSDSQKDLQ
ncbi:MAG: hypothetical protein Q9227_001559 [Pyrenula ochraceoflavens]